MGWRRGFVLFLAGSCAAYTFYADRLEEAGCVAYSDDGRRIVSTFPEALAHAGAREETPYGPAGVFEPSGAAIEPVIYCEPRLISAVYRLALEECLANAEGGVLRAGAAYGVWVRDTAYASLLGLSFAFPDAVRRSLLATLDEERGTIRLEQYPTMTDCLSWAAGAWEYACTTGDFGLLEGHVGALERTVSLVSAEQGDGPLIRGGSSFMDGLDGYPPGVYGHPEYRALSTNLLYGRALWVLERLGRRTDVRARSVAAALEPLWLSERGYYAQGFLRGEPLERYEGLGNLLAVVLGLADEGRAQAILACSPVTGFGVPAAWPPSEVAISYHGDSVWPFLAGFWAEAANRCRRPEEVARALRWLARSAARELTFREVLRGEDGVGTHSARQLWSAAAFLAAVYKGVFGLWPEEEGLRIAPCLPREFAGRVALRGVRWRDSRLSIALSGRGDFIVEASLDGTELVRQPDGSVVVPPDLSGEHVLFIKLDEALLVESEPERAVAGEPVEAVVTARTSQPVSAFVVREAPGGLGTEEVGLEASWEGGRAVLCLEPERPGALVWGVEAEPWGRRLRALRVEPAVTVAVRPERVLAAPAALVRVTLTNNRSRPLEGSLSLLGAGSAGMVAAEEALRLAPGEARTLECLIFRRSGRIPGRARARLLFRGPGSLGSASLEVETRRVVDLSSGPWRFCKGDPGGPASPADPACGDSGWRAIRVGRPWEWEGVTGPSALGYNPDWCPYNGVAWYRCRFTLADPPRRGEATLCLGGVNNSDETYVNGRLVGRTDGLAFTGWNLPREYRFPASLLREGENVIAIRVENPGGEGGIVSLPVEIVLPN